MFQLLLAALSSCKNVVLNNLEKCINNCYTLHQIMNLIRRLHNVIDTTKKMWMFSVQK